MRTEIPETLPPEGAKIELRASFEGLRFLPRWFASGFNNRNPELTLFTDQLEVKTVGRVRIRYPKLSKVDVLRTARTRNVSFTCRRRLTRVTANVARDEDFVALLEFLERKGAPLTDRAKDAMKPAVHA